MSRHTTNFTADPVFRARQEIRNRLERLRDEADTTADTVGAFPGNETERDMWRAVSAMCQGYIDAINAINEVERQRKIAQAEGLRRVGRELGT